MSSEIRSFQVTTPAGILPANPKVTNLAMPARTVRRIEVVVPRGCNGVLGFAFGAAGAISLPYNAGQWFITSGEVVPFDLENQIDSGAWQIQTYNVGNYPHTLNIRFHLDYVNVAPTAPTVDSAALLNLSSGIDITTAGDIPLGTPAGFGV